MPTTRPTKNLAEEFERLKLLRSLTIEDQHLDESLQAIVERVGPLYGTRLCMINLILEDHQYFKSWHGQLPPDVAEARRMPREDSLCTYVVASHIPLVIEDLASTEEWSDHFTQRTYGVRFYAGVPLVANNGHALGSLCLADTEPRTITAEGLETLQFFASRAAAELELAGEHEHTRRLRAELEATSRYAAALSELTITLQTTNDPQKVGDVSLQTLRESAGLDWCALVAVGAGVAWAPHVVGQPPQELEDLRRRHSPRRDGALWMLLESRTPAYVDGSSAHAKDLPGGGAMAFVALPAALPVPSILVASRRGSDARWSRQDRWLLESAARVIGIALQRGRRVSEPGTAGSTDELTGLANRRAFDRLATEPEPLGPEYRVLRADLACFKELNDTMGHAVGDICLRAMTQALVRELRPAESHRIFRYGGDEFVIVASTPGGEELAGRLEAAVASVARDYPGIGLRLDVGGAHVPSEAPDLTEGVTLAASRMDEVKRSRSER